MAAPLFYPEYQLAVGYNNAAGLAAIEGVIPAGGTRVIRAPSIRGGYTRGQEIIRADGSSTFNGFPVVVWTFGWVTYVQRDYLNTTYCSGLWTGEVTVRTRLTAAGAFANYNAILSIPQPSASDEGRLGRIPNFQLTFRRMVAL